MPQGCVDGRYILNGEIGRGGYAVVYEAYDRKSGRAVALKILAEDAMDEVAVARLEREARAAIGINHPNVCLTLDHGRLSDQRPYVVMERLHGETLRSYLRRRGH